MSSIFGMFGDFRAPRGLILPDKVCRNSVIFYSQQSQQDVKAPGRVLVFRLAHRRTNGGAL